MLDVLTAILVSYGPILIVVFVLDIAAAAISTPTLGVNIFRVAANFLSGFIGAWLWVEIYVGIIDRPGVVGLVALCGIIPATLANFHKFNWTYLNMAAISGGRGRPPFVHEVDFPNRSKSTLVATRNTVPEAFGGSLISSLLTVFGILGTSTALTGFMDIAALKYLLTTFGLVGVVFAAFSFKQVINNLPNDY